MNTIFNSIKMVAKVVMIIMATMTIVTMGNNQDINYLTYPKTVKLSLTENPDEMVISWFTNQVNGMSQVQFSQSRGALRQVISGEQIVNFDQSSTSNVFNINGTSSAFSPDSQWSGYSNLVVLSGLEPSTTYYYTCGGSHISSWSSIQQFKTGNFERPTSSSGSSSDSEDTQDDDQNLLETSSGNPNPSNVVTPFTAVVYGDMGFGGGFNQTVQLIRDNLDKYDILFHVGDISYADYDRVEQGNQTVWNDFLATLEPITSRIPYMTTPGNHDTFYGFTAYQQTFNMPGSSDTPWYSFDYNGVHFVSFSTESDLSPFTKQYQWMKNDLETYRTNNPHGWVIAYAHRPYYCSTQWDWCRKQTLRALIESTIGGLFQKYNVDLYMAGHTHAYERTYPVYEQLTIGDYQYPGGTIHMIIGTPGNQEGLDTNWIYPTPSWSAYRYAELGYATLSVHNNTHILWQFISDKDSTVIDEQWIVKGYFD